MLRTELLLICLFPEGPLRRVRFESLAYFTTPVLVNKGQSTSTCCRCWIWPPGLVGNWLLRSKTKTSAPECSNPLSGTGHTHFHLNYGCFTYFNHTIKVSWLEPGLKNGLIFTKSWVHSLEGLVVELIPKGIVLNSWFLKKRTVTWKKAHPFWDIWPLSL